ncbi:universal stress protein [Streptomyces sp. cg36]|uniref:universal stress protein n=1 Tax=Streptomyces sp. cg36 TaxID=3238798 RepID=UPI0034E1A1C2
MPVRTDRVVVGVDALLSQRAALRWAAKEALHRHAVLCPVLAWSPPYGETLSALFPGPEAADTRCGEAARKQLTALCRAALPRQADRLDIEAVVARADAGRALIACATHPTDLLVISADGDHSLRHDRTRRYCRRHAPCPVVVVGDSGPCGQVLERWTPSSSRYSRGSAS